MTIMKRVAQQCKVGLLPMASVIWICSLFTRCKFPGSPCSSEAPPKPSSPTIATAASEAPTSWTPHHAVPIVIPPISGKPHPAAVRPAASASLVGDAVAPARTAPRVVASLVARPVVVAPAVVITVSIAVAGMVVLSIPVPVTVAVLVSISVPLISAAAVAVVIFAVVSRRLAVTVAVSVAAFAVRAVALGGVGGGFVVGGHFHVGVFGGWFGEGVGGVGRGVEEVFWLGEGGEWVGDE